MEIIAIHALHDDEKTAAMSQCVKILNCEWPRSEMKIVDGGVS